MCCSRRRTLRLGRVDRTTTVAAAVALAGYRMLYVGEPQLECHTMHTPCQRGAVIRREDTYLVFFFVRASVRVRAIPFHTDMAGVPERLIRSEAPFLDSI